MITEQIPDSLISSLQEIFADPSNDLKVESAKKKILEWINSPDRPNVQVDREDLTKWIETIRNLKQFKTDAETEIGWVVEAFFNLMKGGITGVMKLSSQLMLGTKKLEDIGLDENRLRAIGNKFAPETMKKLETQKQNGE